jgi:hypothetical protein
VPAVARGQQGGAGQQLGHRVQVVQGGVQRLHLGPHRLLPGPRGLPHLSPDGIQPGGDLAEAAAADVLAHDAAVDLARAAVAAAPVPAHFCCLPAFAPLSVYLKWTAGASGIAGPGGL